MRQSLCQNVDDKQTETGRNQENYERAPENYFGSLILYSVDHLMTKLEGRSDQLNKSAIWGLTLVPSNTDLFTHNIEKYILTCFGYDLDDVDNFS